MLILSPILSLIIMLHIGHPFQAMPETNDWKHRLDSLSHSKDFNGVIMLAQGDSVLFRAVRGYADLSMKRELKATDRFVIGSISKQITAVLIMKLIEKTEIDPHDRISRYLPELNQSWADTVTVHHLLSHTHGIAEMDAPLQFEPGSQFQYSQLGYELLAVIAERITQQSFEELSTQLFREAEMPETMHPTNRTFLNLVKAYTTAEDGSAHLETNSLMYDVAAGGFVSTAQDLLQWTRLLQTGRLIKEASLQKMIRPYALRNHPVLGALNYGYGLTFLPGEESVQVGAFGYVPGFASACFYYPEGKYTLVVLENVAKTPERFKNTFSIHTKAMEIVKHM
ncbi:CubicO group peptidase (beta-lactamase class C family) [Dyadobacter jejuensis]|uniref:CubicO group peptidase (Beta-lactamase class C family) n=1 Tax=Dyadobacter jejuensis TaxID=1082580 RepID=A0A316AMV7_9BACT|nr:serine hydrolase domain-containing protein [Dyadobacter jejuensis]PWJ59063.1 CubicO group peptidase (beta-lactamase class C family) [Dyadobacter jejuensis]